MTDYDKAGRYLIKCDPAGCFRWLLGRAVTFLAWIDARRHALPDQGDLTNDLVAAFREGDTLEALCVELQAASEADTARRLLLGYVPRLLSEPAVPGSLAVTTAGGVVINLTGPPQAATVEHRPQIAPSCWLAGAIEQRTLRDEVAAETLAAIGAGDVGVWLLAWLPLRQGGAEPGIIEGWKRVAATRLNESDRGHLAHLTLTFADLTACRDVWQRALLEGWAVIKSPYLEELREQVRAEGKTEGQLQTLRETILELGRQRFGKAASRKHKAQIAALTDASRLERIRGRLLASASWPDLLATP